MTEIQEFCVTMFCLTVMSLGAIVFYPEKINEVRYILLMAMIGIIGSILYFV